MITIAILQFITIILNLLVQKKPFASYFFRNNIIIDVYGAYYTGNFSIFLCALLKWNVGNNTFFTINIIGIYFPISRFGNFDRTFCLKQSLYRFTYNFFSWLRNQLASSLIYVFYFA